MLVRNNLEIEKNIEAPQGVDVNSLGRTNLLLQLPSGVSSSQFHPSIKGNRVVSIDSHLKKCIFDLDHICRYAAHAEKSIEALRYYVPS